MVCNIQVNTIKMCEWRISTSPTTFSFFSVTKIHICLKFACTKDDSRFTIDCISCHTRSYLVYTRLRLLANGLGFTILTILNANKPETSKWGRSKVVGLDFHLDFNNFIHINIFPHTFKQDFNLTFLKFEFIGKLSIFNNPNFHPFPEVCYSHLFQFIYKRKGALLF